MVQRSVPVCGSVPIIAIMMPKHPAAMPAQRGVARQDRDHRYAQDRERQQLRRPEDRA